MDAKVGGRKAAYKSKVEPLGLDLYSKSKLAGLLNVTPAVVDLAAKRAGAKAMAAPPSWVWSHADALAIEAAYHAMDPEGRMQRTPTGRRGRPRKAETGA